MLTKSARLRCFFLYVLYHQQKLNECICCVLQINRVLRLFSTMKTCRRLSNICLFVMLRLQDNKKQPNLCLHCELSLIFYHSITHVFFLFCKKELLNSGPSGIPTPPWTSSLKHYLLSSKILGESNLRVKFVLYINQHVNL